MGQSVPTGLPQAKRWINPDSLSTATLCHHGATPSGFACIRIGGRVWLKQRPMKTRLAFIAVFAAMSILQGCCSVYPGKPVARNGDEIMVAGRLFHTGAPVVLWTDANGYDAYRRAWWFKRTARKAGNAPAEAHSPNVYGVRDVGRWSAAELKQIRMGRWTLAELRQVVNKIVLHYDATGTSRRCFEVLEKRGLSTHFMIDLDGTIYQTLDVKERAWTATIANSRGINIEIANVGVHPPAEAEELGKWYHHDPTTGKTVLTIPPSRGDGGLLHPDIPLRPMRPEPVIKTINGRRLEQYDFTPAQYRSLIKLTAALCRIFPKIRIQCPRNATGGVLMKHPMTPTALHAFCGIVGHQHVQQNKDDPGPAFEWDYYLRQVRATLANAPGRRNDNARR